MKSAASLVLMASIGISTAVLADWQRLPFSETIPVNLANRAIPGTSLVSSDGIGSANSLISASVSEPVALPSGKSEAVIQVVGQHVIDEVRFSNDSAEGKVSVAASIDAKKWQPVGQTVFVSSMNEVVVRFAGAQARYVRVSFELAKGSTIRGFAIYGATTNKDYKLVQSEVGSAGEAASSQPLAAGGNAARQPAAAGENAAKESKNEGGSGSTVNLAAGGGAKAIYAFPPPINTNEAEMRKNVFRFPKSKERFRVIIYDLGSARKIKQFASAYSQRPTRLEVFAFEQLPEKKDWRGKLTLDPAIFTQTKPVAAGEDARGVGHLKLVPEKPINAQFVALRFEPNYNRQVNTSDDQEEWSAGLASAMIPFSGFMKEFGFLGGGRMVQAVPGDTGTGVAADVFDVSGVAFEASALAAFKLLTTQAIAQRTEKSRTQAKKNADGSTTYQITFEAGNTQDITETTDPVTNETTTVVTDSLTGITTTTVKDSNGRTKSTIKTDGNGNPVTGETTPGASRDPNNAFLQAYANRNLPNAQGSPPGSADLFNAIIPQGFTPTNLQQLQTLLNTLENFTAAGGTITPPPPPGVTPTTPGGTGG
jgi:hypothetical protein